MSEKRNKRKAVLLLTCLILFSIFIVSKTKHTKVRGSNSDTYTVVENIQEESCDTCGLEQDIFIEIGEGFQPVKEIFPELILNESDVLGTDTGCRTPSVTYSSEKICERSVTLDNKEFTKQEEVSIGGTIRRNASIRLTGIEVPPLLNGSPTMDDETRQISENAWTLRPAGSMVEKQVVLGNTFPGDEQTKALIANAESNKTKPFGISYSISGATNAEGSGNGAMTIQDYQKNDCGADCRNVADPNPGEYLSASEVQGKSNNYAKYYQKEVIEQNDEIYTCDNNSIFKTMDLDTDYTACTPTLKDVVVSFFKRITSAIDVDNCSTTSESTEKCVSTASIVVIMESPWGSKKDCADGLCVTEYNDLRNGAFAIPNDTDEKKLYVLTDCYANVDGKNTKLSCAWDFDYISEELEFQSQDNIPGEVFPDRMDYINFHIQESEARTDPVYPML